MRTLQSQATAHAELTKGSELQRVGPVGLLSPEWLDLKLIGFVVAIEYLSDDSADKIIAFYQDKLKRYGSVLECHTSKHGGDVEVNKMGRDQESDDNKESKQLTCKGSDRGNTVELKVGTEDNQH